MLYYCGKMSHTWVSVNAALLPDYNKNVFKKILLHYASQKKRKISVLAKLFQQQNTLYDNLQ